MRPARIIALVLGCLLVVPGIALLLGAGALGAGYAFGRDDDGYFVATIDEVSTSAVAVTAEDFDFTTDPGTPDQVFDRLGIDLRQRVTSLAGDRPVFVGIADAEDLDAYLAEVAHDVVVDVNDQEVTYRHVDGARDVTAPTEETFWEASAWGTGTQELVWQLHDGDWAVVLMNVDGTPGVAAEVEVGVQADVAVPLIFGVGLAGSIIAVVGIFLVIVGAAGGPAIPTEGAEHPAASGAPRAHPVHLSAEIDPQVSRWRWMVKWLLAIPHLVVLGFLWVGFAVSTAFAGVSVIVTGRYPRGLFDFNVGVLRWSFRVSHYAGGGGLGTDHYPPFTLRAMPADSAHLDIAYPDHLSRGLALVKWWLLAIPHYLLIGLVVGTFGWTVGDTDISTDLIGLLTFVTGVLLLVNGKVPQPLFDLLIGLNRWLYRVIAYVAFMTDVYPPFRLDQGGPEPSTEPPAPPSPPQPPGELRSTDATERDLVGV